ncbi:hypothetical protein [Pseudomonas protegens]|uniref:hypothetical protein n=1 Tax=Pseudomonas protegens TaxID=380021 RepID=UPI001B32F376|nr:hypothetical protein [Pseudomonas protegens]MBP5127102.1 hypothetical protein [Pseudomonas protegens]
MNKAIETLPYYGPTAYSPSDVPDQPTPIEQSWLLKFSGVRLPWGNTQDVAPDSIMEDPTPDDMRFAEKLRKDKEEKKPMVLIFPRL